MELAIVGPVKVKDGIFMGDEFAAHVISLAKIKFIFRILNFYLLIK